MDIFLCLDYKKRKKSFKFLKILVCGNFEWAAYARKLYNIQIYDNIPVHIHWGPSYVNIKQ